MHFVVTAGPTREHLDPVRFLSNPSTGRMGFEVARAAAAAGHDVELVAGPVSLRTPAGVRRVDVISARDMLSAVEAALVRVRAGAVALVMTAAVADWRPASRSPAKMKKSQMDGALRLVRNPDILRTLDRELPPRLKARLVRVGFAAETGDPASEAVRKCREKGLDMVVANDVSLPGSGFGTRTNKVDFVFPDGRVEHLPLMSKAAVARRIVALAAEICAVKR